MNKKGFMMAELVVVSSIVLVTLVGLYTSHNKIFSIYKQRINYYDVPTLYELAYVRSNLDFSVISPSVSENLSSVTGTTVYYVNKYDIVNINPSNQTYKEYLDFLVGSLNVNNLNIDGNSITNILLMEKCDSDGYSNCKYAYLGVLGVNQKTDITPPTCTISASSSEIIATYSDGEGSSGISYYGWDSSYSGTTSTSKSIATGTHTYYVMDEAGNKGTCQIQITGTNSSRACPSGYEEGSFVENNVIYACRKYDCGAPPCDWFYSNYVTTYSCASGYTKINDSYCYKK